MDCPYVDKVLEQYTGLFETVRRPPIRALSSTETPPFLFGSMGNPRITSELPIDTVDPNEAGFITDIPEDIMTWSVNELVEENVAGARHASLPFICTPPFIETDGERVSDGI